MNRTIAVLFGVAATSLACGTTTGADAGPGGNPFSFTDGGTSNHPDSGSTGNPDSGSSAGADAGPLSCFGETGCLNNCTTQACATACTNDSTMTANNLNNTFANCQVAACPQTDGGPCVDVTSTACNDCAQNASGGGGQCASSYTACIDDMSGSPGPSTGNEGCGALLNCLNNCQTQSSCNTCFNEATAEAQQLYYEAGACIGNACPSEGTGATCALEADGGTSTACNNCQNAAQMTGGACYTALGNCANN